MIESLTEGWWGGNATYKDPSSMLGNNDYYNPVQKRKKVPRWGGGGGITERAESRGTESPYGTEPTCK
jgi:hypothetical protein